MRLLVAQDDVDQTRMLERSLRTAGYEVDVAFTGDEVIEKATAGGYDTVVLDVMLPGIDGYSVCETLRRRHCRMPVMLVSARGEVTDRIRGLDAGADDYLVKPFDAGELLARLRALLRRERRPAPPAVFESGDLRIDPATRVVTRVGREIELTAREFEVLELLAEHQGEVVSRAQLLEHVWAENFDGSPNIVDVYIGYLRKKLDRSSSGRRLIRTVRGVGFMLEPG
jgi:two-component system OmpR family response regulator